MSDIFTQQIKILKLTKSYLKSVEKRGINTLLSPICFFTNWANSQGYYKIKHLIYKFDIKNIFFYIKDIISICFHHDLIVINKNLKNKKYKSLIVSYCTSENFSSKGIFYDKYFDLSSKDKNFAWFLISLDHRTPSILEDNIVILKKKKYRSFSIIFLIKFVLKNIIINYLSLSKIFHNTNSMNAYSLQVSNLFRLFLKRKEIKNYLINYEGVPFQNYLIKEIKKKNLKNSVFCYLHCAPWPLQLDLLYKKNKMIDKFFVSGIDQKNKLIKYLDWPEKKIIQIPSLRFKKISYLDYAGYIFIPYTLENSDNYLERFVIFLKNQKNQSLHKMKLRIHPLNKNSKKHIKFVKDLDNILKKFKQKFSSRLKQNSSIIFGSATGVCTQSLEYGVKILHFPQDIFLDVYSNKIWPNIKVTKLDDKIYLYSIEKMNRGNMFNEVKYNNRFKKYLLPHIKSKNEK